MPVINLNNCPVCYSIKKYANAKCVKIAVHLGGEVTVTTPKRLSQCRIDALLKSKAAWLVEKIRQQTSVEMTDLTIRSREHYLTHKESARMLIESKVRVWAQELGLSHGSISIKNPRTRWGSCSCKGNLNFNYKIKFLPPELQDYIIVHELCHLRELNHSKKFWCLVEEVLPAQKQHRTDLKGVMF